MKFDKFIRTKTRPEVDDWHSVSDLMAGLMVIFLFIAITYLRPIVETQNKIREIVVTWNASEVEIQQALEKEFSRDLAKWNAELDGKTLAIRFMAPNVLFDPSSSELKPEFIEILADFFPRYLDILHNFRYAIAEVRIEGHTSSEWPTAANEDEAYFRNMSLSQSRTRSVLEYCLALEKVQNRKNWARELITANGLSSSRIIVGEDGQEDRTASRRVEFRVRTNAKEQIVKILETVQ